MGFVTFEELAGIVLFFIIVGCIASIFGFRLRPPKPARTQAAPAAPISSCSLPPTFRSARSESSSTDRSLGFISGLVRSFFREHAMQILHLDSSILDDASASRRLTAAIARALQEQSPRPRWSEATSPPTRSPS
jgi:hypothetical protein